MAPRWLPATFLLTTALAASLTLPSLASADGGLPGPAVSVPSPFHPPTVGGVSQPAALPQPVTMAPAAVSAPVVSAPPAMPSSAGSAQSAAPAPIAPVSSGIASAAPVMQPATGFASAAPSLQPASGVMVSRPATSYIPPAPTNNLPAVPVSHAAVDNPVATAPATDTPSQVADDTQTSVQPAALAPVATSLPEPVETLAQVPNSLPAPLTTPVQLPVGQLPTTSPALSPAVTQPGGMPAQPMMAASATTAITPIKPASTSLAPGVQNTIAATTTTQTRMSATTMAASQPQPAATSTNPSHMSATSGTATAATRDATDRISLVPAASEADFAMPMTESAQGTTAEALPSESATRSLESSVVPPYGGSGRGAEVGSSSTSVKDGGDTSAQVTISPAPTGEAALPLVQAIANTVAATGLSGLDGRGGSATSADLTALLLLLLATGGLKLLFGEHEQPPSRSYAPAIPPG